MRNIVAFVAYAAFNACSICYGVLCISHQQGDTEMDANSIIEAVKARRASAGFLVSVDRETPELTAKHGRFTRYCIDANDRADFIKRCEKSGRNPRIEG